MIFLFLQSCSFTTISDPNRSVATVKDPKVVIAKGLRQNRLKLKTCTKGQAYPSQQRLIAHFVILPSGEIQRVGLGENNLPIKLQSCIVKVLYQLQFPELGSDTPLKVVQGFLL